MGANSGEVDGPRIKLPDIEDPGLAALGRCDTVGAGFTYYGSITRGGVSLPDDVFGRTLSFFSRLSEVTVTPDAGTLNVSAIFEHPIKFQIRSGIGPERQVDIASDSDPDINQNNYHQVGTDLIPNSSDLNGRSPREFFWAEDLTLRHELLHANDDLGQGPGAMGVVTTWLNSQSAAHAADVHALLAQVPGRFAQELLAGISTEDGERRAYGDGAPHYAARAQSIMRKGNRGEYPLVGPIVG